MLPFPIHLHLFKNNFTSLLRGATILQWGLCTVLDAARFRGPNGYFYICLQILTYQMAWS